MSVRIAEARAEFAKRYPSALIVRAYEDRNLNLDCECAAAGPVVYIEFAFGRDGKLCPRYHPSLYCAGCGMTWHESWKRELWERLTKHENVHQIERQDETGPGLLPEENREHDGSTE